MYFIFDFKLIDCFGKDFFKLIDTSNLMKSILICTVSVKLHLTNIVYDNTALLCLKFINTSISILIFYKTII